VASRYRYLHVVQGNYGHGWEDLFTSESIAEALAKLDECKKNDPFPENRYQKILHREKRT